MARFVENSILLGMDYITFYLFDKHPSPSFLYLVHTGDIYIKLCYQRPFFNWSMAICGNLSKQLCQLCLSDN